MLAITHAAFLHCSKRPKSKSSVNDKRTRPARVHPKLNCCVLLIFSAIANVYFKKIPDHVSVVEGEKLEIHCKAFGTDPTISWTVGEFRIAIIIMKRKNMSKMLAVVHFTFVRCR